MPGHQKRVHNRCLLRGWAQRNKVDLRDLHIRNVGGQRVEVGIRKSAYDQRENYDNRHGQRQDGFWR
ncbi:MULTISPECIES: hypothetical protein [unclassified Blastomonas]|uniref:hypothetical protein n=1 Tax=unclassified Blastomonas TaxID=2626550 RepID=UPI0008248171|nr:MULTISPECIES: hypothetical protein [unclassified Blastomonas]